ncbi:hypothetical protein DOTSEDRAFT_161970 [Dothistroma septosporum NZE10]|uniref:Uncharacterized protein n=1 Tax=Dothistroma septosporum (strain NZE10 / CBS 128990) TaxID=675120 RepID=N1PY36_DOTSN|nr:hypothetical protein DOTSEDRAFT_161970 [Dothistroma septosporum NZE10]
MSGTVGDDRAEKLEEQQAIAGYDENEEGDVDAHAIKHDDEAASTASRLDATIDDDDMHGALPATEQQDEDDDEDEDEDLPYPEPEQDEPLLPPAGFRPFFTLVEDGTGEHHHPNVHYVFADDDPDILTSAALEMLQDSRHEREVEERFVILDFAADGKEIISATSLSPDWQAMQTKLSAAPSWGGDDGKSRDKGLMLTISGREAGEGNTSKDKARKEDIEALLKTFDEHMGSLDGVLGTEETDATIDTPATEAL